MNTILLTAGVVALMAAVIGGGLRAFQIEVPVLQSRGVRVALGALGVAFLLAAVLVPQDSGDSRARDEARRQQELQARHEREVQERRKQESQARLEREVKARYQRSVEATCSAMRRATSNLSFVPGPGQNIDRDATLAQWRAGFEAGAQRLQLLFDKSAPASLRHEVKVARGRSKSYIRNGRHVFSTLAASLPTYPTLEEFRAAASSDPQDQAVGFVARLEDAMTELAGRDCSLSAS
jgi:hypothetical protein